MQQIGLLSVEGVGRGETKLATDAPPFRHVVPQFCFTAEPEAKVSFHFQFPTNCCLKMILNTLQ